MFTVRSQSTRRLLVLHRSSTHRRIVCLSSAFFPRRPRAVHAPSHTVRASSTHRSRPSCIAASFAHHSRPPRTVASSAHRSPSVRALFMVAMVVIQPPFGLNLLK
ncbi:hypothetical protein DEO72_LG5g1054 [Vigna unguiculata]|uniref:Uncharacterized protein n=1 Tax=Vigna unguiculata TaxID=3917 RepID=A0A4D6LYP0_VIGUN|nr:hypothetical protein DEO72_LG5g1054 [Vigna unguiculata]